MLGKQQNDRRDSTWYGEEAWLKFDNVIRSYKFETNILNLERVMLGKRQSDRRDSTWYGEEAWWKFDNAGRSYKFKRKYFEK